VYGVPISHLVDRRCRVNTSSYQSSLPYPLFVVMEMGDGRSMPRSAAAAAVLLGKKTGDRGELPVTSSVPLRCTVRHTENSFTTLISHYFRFSGAELDLSTVRNYEPIPQQQL
jgi:hypothetical protein